jgi:hypothetical protein
MVIPAAMAHGVSTTSRATFFGVRDFAVRLASAPGLPVSMDKTI